MATSRQGPAESSDHWRTILTEQNWTKIRILYEDGLSITMIAVRFGVAALAALPGFIDFLSIHDAETKSLAWKHMSANVIGLVVFIVAFWLQCQNGSPGPSAVPLSLLGVLSIAVGGWLGGELVYVNGMAVERVDKLEIHQACTTESHPS